MRIICQETGYNIIRGGACEPENPISTHRIHTCQPITKKRVTWGAGRHIFGNAASRGFKMYGFDGCIFDRNAFNRTSMSSDPLRAPYADQEFSTVFFMTVFHIFLMCWKLDILYLTRFFLLLLMI